MKLAAGQLNAPREKPLILIERPARSDTTQRLGEVLEGLEPLLEHVAKLEAAQLLPKTGAALKS